MLKALYDYGVAHPEIVQLPGHAPLTLKFVVDLTSTCDVVGIRRSDRKTVIAPDAGSAKCGTGTTCGPFMEKAEIAISLETDRTGKALDRVKGKRECFLDYLRDAVHIPACETVLAVLTDPAKLAEIQRLADDLKVKPGDTIGFAVDSELITDMPAVREHWVKTVPDDCSDAVRLDVVTGLPCRPARVHKPVPSSILGGQGRGPVLVSFNQPAFKSYGDLSLQAENCPMARATADTISDALTDLCRKAPRVADVKFLHWFDKPVAQEDDPVSFLFDDLFPDAGSQDGASEVDADVAEAEASRLIRSPLTGEVPQALTACEYHIIMLRQSDNRISVSRYERGRYESLYANVKDWFDGMELMSSNGTGLIRPRKLNSMLYQLLSVSEKAMKTDKMKPLNPLVPAILDACINNRPVPDAVASRALQAVMTSVYDKNAQGVNPLAVQWLKLWLCRRHADERSKRPMSTVTPGLDSVAYHCGRLLAAYDAIQKFKNPDVGSGVLTTYFSACIQSPAFVLGQMQSMSVYHMAKIDYPNYKAMFEDVLSGIWADIRSGIPTAMNLEDQAYFTAGYWHQQAEINRRLAELRAASKAKKAATNGTDENDNTDKHEQEDK